MLSLLNADPTFRIVVRLFRGPLIRLGNPIRPKLSYRSLPTVNPHPDLGSRPSRVHDPSRLLLAPYRRNQPRAILSLYPRHQVRTLFIFIAFYSNLSSLDRPTSSSSLSTDYSASIVVFRLLRPEKDSRRDCFPKMLLSQCRV